MQIYRLLLVNLLIEDMFLSIDKMCRLHLMLLLRDKKDYGCFNKKLSTLAAISHLPLQFKSRPFFVSQRCDYLVKIECCDQREKNAEKFAS